MKNHKQNNDKIENPKTTNKYLAKIRSNKKWTQEQKKSTKEAKQNWWTFNNCTFLKKYYLQSSSNVHFPSILLHFLNLFLNSRFVHNIYKKIV